jgi:Tfp pilus assembly protein PilO
MELSREKLRVIGIALSALLIIGGYLIVFRPVRHRLRLLHKECKTLETELGQAHRDIELLKSRDIKRRLVSEREVALAIDELTKLGKSCGINFISLAPGQIEARKVYDVLPIDMEIESTFDGLGDFLGKLDELKRTIVKVKGFTVVGVPMNPKMLSTRLNLEMCLSE